nr:PREDICTED: gastrula zinc finger protein XlCGF57.1-like [Linepithema humile]
MYSWASNLRKHLKMGCGMVTFETHFSCQYCPYRSRIEASFLKHLLSCRTIDSMWCRRWHSRFCESDLRLLVYPLALEDWEMVDSDTTSRLGNYAGRKIRFKRECMEHRYRCSKCAKSYRWKHHLVEHMKAFCGQKKEECCPFCSYKSNRKWNLKSHMKRIHAST